MGISLEPWVINAACQEIAEVASKADDEIPRAALFWVPGKNPWENPRWEVDERSLYNKFNKFKSFHVFSSHKASGNWCLRDEQMLIWHLSLRIFEEDSMSCPPVTMKFRVCNFGGGATVEDLRALNSRRCIHNPPGISRCLLSMALLNPIRLFPRQELANLIPLTKCPRIKWIRVREIAHSLTG